MKAKHTMFRKAGVAAAAGLLTVLALPVSAAGAPSSGHESYSITGVLADARWFADESQEPPVGLPRVLSVEGADATRVQQVRGTKPQRTSQPAVVAMGLMMPGIEAGDEPYPAELWCVTDDFTFTVADALASAKLEIPACEAQVFTYDEATGEEAPNGVTVMLSVTTTWTATGPIESVKSHSRYLVGQSWTLDRQTASMRPASADITMSGLPGGTFAGTAQDAVIQDIRVGSLLKL